MPWTFKTTGGVIDSHICYKLNLVSCADTQGNLTLLDFTGNLVYQVNFRLPIWGVSMSECGNFVAVSLAIKGEKQKGGMVILEWEKGKIRFQQECRKEVWDVEFIPNTDKVIWTTWGDGIYIYDLKQKEINQINYSQNLFGICYSSNEIFINVSSKGVIKVDLKTYKIKKLAATNLDNCYNIRYDERSKKIYSGSNSNILTEYIKIQNEWKLNTYKFESSNQETLKPCAIGILDNFILLGGLNGLLKIINKKDFTCIKIFNFKDSIWNISYDRESKIILIAVGSGILYFVKFENISSLTLQFTQLGIINQLPKSLRVFISYSRKDLKTVLKIYNELLDFGLKPWLDIKNLLPGQDWKYETSKAIRDSDFVVVCLSQNMLHKKGYVHKELQEVLQELEMMPEGNIYMIPIRLDNCKIPERLSNWHWLDYQSQNGLNKIIESIIFQNNKFINN